MDEENKELGQGGYGSIKTGIINGRLMAIKSFHNRVDWPEIDIMCNYEHPNIMKAHLLPSGDKYAMEIGNEVEGDFTSMEEFISFVYQACQGLHFLHSRGVLHLDIKRRNFVKVGDTYKYIDFGISRIFSPNTLEAQFVRGLRGTMGYVPPETEVLNINKQAVFTMIASSRADVFALGWTLLYFFRDLRTIYETNLKELYTLYRTNGGKESFLKTKNHPTALWYYFHKELLSDPAQVLVLVGTTISERFPKIPEEVIFAITEMLSFEMSLRPTMDRVMKILGMEVIPGLFSVYLPEKLRNVSLVEFVKKFNKLPMISKWAVEVIDLFRIYDLWIRSDIKNPKDLLQLVVIYSKSYISSKEIIDRMAISHKVPISKADYSKINVNLRGSLCSCNLFYRLANSIEALVYVSKLDPSKVDFYELKNYIDGTFEPGDKSITVKDFIGLL